jgi:hypothetical protein
MCLPYLGDREANMVAKEFDDRDFADFREKLRRQQLNITF